MTHIPSLQIAILAEREVLPEELRAAVREMSGSRPGYFLFQLAMAWIVIGGMITWAALADSVWVSLLTIIVVASRQNVFALLVHEQAHCLGFKPKFGDLFVNLFVAYPLLLLTVQDYAKVHLSHHKYFFTERDPDHLRKSGPEWTIPMRPAQLAKLLLRDVLGLNVLKLVRGKRAAPGQASEFSRKTHPLWRLGFLGGLVLLLSLTGTWHLFLLYWLLPLLTVFQLIVRWGALAEHKYNLPGASVAESTPVIVPSWLDRLLLPNLNFSLHVYHHYFPAVSAGNLPRLHQMYCDAGLVAHKSLFYGYTDYLRFILGLKRKSTADRLIARG